MVTHGKPMLCLTCVAEGLSTLNEEVPTIYPSSGRVSDAEGMQCEGSDLGLPSGGLGARHQIRMHDSPESLSPVAEDASESIPKRALCQSTLNPKASKWS